MASCYSTSIARSSSRALVTVVVLSAALPGRAAPDDDSGSARRILETCRRNETSGGIRFACEGFAASVADYPGLSPDAALDIHIGSLKPLGEISSAPGQFSSGGKRWSARRFSVRRADGSVAFEGRAAAFAIRAGTARLVSCGGNAARLSSCDAVMQLLATTGPAPYAAPKAAPSFLGRKLPVPKGCEVMNASETQFRMRCGELAGVSFLRLQTPEHIDRFSETVREQVLKNLPGAAEEEPRACKIGGEAARCKVVVSGAGANRTTFFIGGAVVQGVPVSVQCVQHAFVKGVHPVCASIMTF